MNHVDQLFFIFFLANKLTSYSQKWYRFSLNLHFLSILIHVMEKIILQTKKKIGENVLRFRKFEILAVI